MKTKLRSSVHLAIALSAVALTAHASPQSFDFKDPKGVNNVQFQLDAPLESITGTTNGITGAVTFDVDNPGATTGRIVVDAASLTVGNALMREHLLGSNWLDVAQNPTITFEAAQLGNVRKQGTQVSADVSGKLTIKGISRDVTVPVTFTHLPDKLGARLGDTKLKGDLLVLRASFVINRSDYGIMAGQATDKVAESINLSLSIAGAAPRG